MWGEEGRQLGEPFLAAVLKVVGGQGIGESLQGLRIATLREGIGGLSKADSSLLQTIGNPVVLVQTYARRERKVRTDPHKHPSPLAIVQIEVVLIDPSLFQFQMPAILLLRPNRRHDARRFTALQDADNLVRLRCFKVGPDKIVAPPFRRIENGRSPFL